MNLKSMSQKVMAILALSVLLVISTFAGNTEAASSVNSSELVATAKDLIGTKYRGGGTTKAGFDCSGFVSYVYNDLGVSLPRTSSGMYASGSKIDKSDLSSGDLVFFNTSGRGVSHVGIYIGDGKFIHSSTSKGVKIDKLSDPYYWGDRYVGAKRIADVTVAVNK
ncbi:C40 family peptidase [Psychrobacillus psychrodurans]|jgi:cell wall-associated NlpC family hydrolase|uniref:C40 family peptidase n=1 Tax=Psychrobacillus psychrodurans TaxID=126157 RepID=A0A9X3L5H6_9BACI|nr:C40 family peptidase [Psychrobacillus psychrodurans]MCK1996008.1 C40 family peptidase [Psychrobacillus psychrodurans]MCZ8531772.1 C40 family peptidase [Psychrobacillus psychrodurans]MCZ8539244.1 C40 family peptidase [Psychrobacillus psychrodurans]SFM34784.1 NlpC/P60 family protein [Psychrobacillus psychrodurans]